MNASNNDYWVCSSTALRTRMQAFLAILATCKKRRPANNNVAIQPSKKRKTGLPCVLQMTSVM